MKIGEAWQTYSAQVNDLWERKRALLKQQKGLHGAAGKEAEYDTVTIRLSEIDERYQETQNFMNMLLEMKTALHNEAVAKQQGEALSKEAENVSKCIETARRIASGGKVPEEDVKRLMEYNPQMYIQALNAAVMNEYKSRKEYDSLWEEEDGAKEYHDVDAEIDEMTLNMEVPETVPEE